MKLNELKQIETPRLIIRPVELGDEVEINQAINRSLDSLQRWMPWAKDPSFETTEKFVKRAVANRVKNCFHDFPLVVVHKGDNKIISATGFNEKSEFDIGVYEIGYWVDIQYQGQGYVTEFVAAITRLAFEYLGAIRTQIATQVENEKSVSVAKRCGFHLEATMKNHRVDCVSGKPADSYLFVITDPKKVSPDNLTVESQDKDNHTMRDLNTVLAELKSREPIFHRPEHGTTRKYFEKMTVDDFWEIGASGNRYERDFVIDTVVERYKDPDYIKNDFWETSDFACRELAIDCYLLTYTLLQGKEKRLTKRSTVWVYVDGQWKIVYHQGTVINE